MLRQDPVESLKRCGNCPEIVKNGSVKDCVWQTHFLFNFHFWSRWEHLMKAFMLIFVNMVSKINTSMLWSPTLPFPCGLQILNWMQSSQIVSSSYLAKFIFRCSSYRYGSFPPILDLANFEEDRIRIFTSFTITENHLILVKGFITSSLASEVYIGTLPLKISAAFSFLYVIKV